MLAANPSPGDEPVLMRLGDRLWSEAGEVVPPFPPPFTCLSILSGVTLASLLSCLLSRSTLACQQQ